MRQIVFSKLGGSEVLEMVEVENPVPGPGEIFMKNEALGLNRAENMYRSAATTICQNAFHPRWGTKPPAQYWRLAQA